MTPILLDILLAAARAVAGERARRPAGRAAARGQPHAAGAPLRGDAAHGGPRLDHRRDEAASPSEAPSMLGPGPAAVAGLARATPMRAPPRSRSSPSRRGSAAASTTVAARGARRAAAPAQGLRRRPYQVRGARAGRRRGAADRRARSTTTAARAASSAPARPGWTRSSRCTTRTSSIARSRADATLIGVNTRDSPPSTVDLDGARCRWPDAPRSAARRGRRERHRQRRRRAPRCATPAPPRSWSARACCASPIPARRRAAVGRAPSASRGSVAMHPRVPR